MEEHKAKPKPSSLRQLMALAATLLLGPTSAGRKAENPDVHFEESDINIRGVLLTGLGILVMTWVCVGLLYFPFEYLSSIHKQAEAVQAASTATVQLPPEPRLQRSPATDLREYVQSSEAQLKGYQWIDRQRGTVAIPIERAMQLIAQRGIPPQKAAPKLFYTPQEGSRLTGFEGKVEPEPR